MMRIYSRLLVALALAASLCAGVASAQTAPSLGSAHTFAIVGASTVTNTGTSVVTGDLGLSPGTSITGFPPGLVVAGTVHAADSTALAAQNSITTAYNSLGAQACTQDLTGQNLGGLTLTPGVYCFSSSAQLTGTLTLNALGNANAVFIFKVGTALTTASNARVLVINSGQICDVFWRIGSSATLGTSTVFAGNILANTSVTLNTSAQVTGRVFARTGAVTLDTNTVSVSNCAGVSGPGCPSIALTPATLPGGTRLTAYSQTITASGGTAPYTFALASGTLPTGLSLSSTGVLSGIPTTAGVFLFTVRGTDSAGCFADITYTITIVSAAPCPPISVSPAALPSILVGVSDDHFETIVGSGGTAPYSFSIVSGSLPPGVALSDSGSLSGTATTAGLYSFDVRATDALGCFAEISYTIAVGANGPCPPVTFSPARLPNGVQAVAYSQTITGSGGTGPFTFALTSGVLPAGLTLSTTGVLSGTPTVPGPYTFTVTRSDANGCLSSISYTMIIVAAVPTLPQLFAFLLALGLAAIGYVGLTRRTRMLR